MSAVHKIITGAVGHGGDCGETLCGACGCCLHCADDCPCEGVPGCRDHYCNCDLAHWLRGRA